jgi:hypothetical protein
VGICELSSVGLRLALKRAHTAYGCGRDYNFLKPSVLLIVSSNHVVSAALMIHGTPRCACIQVRRAPPVGHVVQT